MERIVQRWLGVNTRALFLGLSLFAISCGTSSAAGDPDGGGDASATGDPDGGGDASSAGDPDGGGDASGGCAAHPLPPRIVVHDASDATPSQSTSVSATVAAIDSCATVDCGAGWDSSARRYVLTSAGGAQLTMFVFFPGLPADLIAVGDAIDLRVDVTFVVNNGANAYNRYTTAVRRSGALILFDSDHVSDLAADGIGGGSQDQIICSDACAGDFEASVTVGTATSTPNAPGQTVHLGGLAIWIKQSTRPTGGCDAPSVFSIAGYRLP